MGSSPSMTLTTFRFEGVGGPATSVSGLASSDDVAASDRIRLVVNVDGDANADGDDRVLNIYGDGTPDRYPDNASNCLVALTLDANSDVYAADRCLGFVVRITRQTG